jgi:hypothetical protein
MNGSIDRLVRDARQVLDDNWLGSSTVPSRSLYPHQWSWDSAFISLGRSWYDERRAQLELETLFSAQWANGMLPHIVFNPAVDEEQYFPGPGFWDSRRSPDAPRDIATSGITQPPIHARAALEMHRHARDVQGSRAFLARLYPKLAAQHAYLAHHRDPTGTGLPIIVHPWESGLDNSPIWDRDLRDLVIPPGGVPPYRRSDILHADPADRPTDATYDRFVYLVARYRDSGYDDATRLGDVPFAIAGPLFAAIYLWSTHALVEIASIVGADPAPHRDEAARIHEAIGRELWDPAAGRFYARDVIVGHLEPEESIVSFAPLLDPDLPTERVDAIVADLASACFHPEAKDHFVVPSYSVQGPGFDRRRYWRGPVWINTNWLLWSGLRQHGREQEATEIARASLGLVARSGFREYFDPFGGAGYGSDRFSWSAALALDLIHRLDADEIAPVEAADPSHGRSVTTPPL